MMVTFISECEKKALPKSRRVLDAFANRIGTRTWQTVITLEGLDAVKKLLRKTASKNTAVSCHWIRSRSRSELVWVVGNRKRFDAQGNVPVNITEADISQYQDDSRWKTRDVILYASKIAGLFHDFGKANLLFQAKINPNKKTAVFEPYRHEWVSLRLFQAFVGTQSDTEWLNQLAEVSDSNTNECIMDGLNGQQVTPSNHPILTLPSFARLVAWIILSHHRLPLKPAWKDDVNSASFEHIDQWLEGFDAVWNSYQCKDEDQKNRVKDNWTFSEKALPYHSKKWGAHARIIASEAKERLAGFLNNEHEVDFINDHLFTGHLARLSMMLADHYYSAQKDVTNEWRGDAYSVYANTYGNNDEQSGFKQQLDEHLIGVALNAGEITEKLTKLGDSLKSLETNEFLTNPVKKKDKDNFGWQDTAVKLVTKLGKDTVNYGFFGINMASTGKGKTIANAKIMYAIGEEVGRTRFSVAIGLRSLTLQTGKEFRDTVGLNQEELAIAVGGTAVKQLFEYKNIKDNSNANETGSESGEEIIDDELYVDYSGTLYDHSLRKWTKKRDRTDKPDNRLDKLLCAPVLVSTIDHLIPATEGTKGGKQIGPMLRLLTSDLVLDEPDDFGLSDLPALCRLVHWAGVLGSRVLFSTATMPPVLASALFAAYRAGWSQYAKANIARWDGTICCAWFDESSSSEFEKRFVSDGAAFKTQHKRFITQRVKKLSSQSDTQRLGEIVTVQEAPTKSGALAKTIHENIFKLHQQHHVSDVKNRHISIGLVRMANINPLVAVAKALLKIDAPDDTCIHYCIYHSRYPLAIRSDIEQNLDTILKRKDPSQIWSTDNGVGKIVDKHPQNNHIFIVLASPVAEVGRDHDYDWAIVEPSSMRSIIQLAGRVLRHRSDVPKTPNIVLLSKNYKALGGKEICFEKPGFEMKHAEYESPKITLNKIKLATHDLGDDLLSLDQYTTINAIPRITPPSAESCKLNESQEHTNLNSLEHSALVWQLFTGKKSAKIWWDKQPYWCGEVQRQQRFRDSNKDDAYYLYVDEYKRPYWCWLNEEVYPAEISDELSGIKITFSKDVPMGKNTHFWFDLSPRAIYTELTEISGLSLPQVSRKFGELRVTNYNGNDRDEYCYHDNLGLYQEVDEQ